MDCSTATLHITIFCALVLKVVHLAVSVFYVLRAWECKKLLSQTIPVGVNIARKATLAIGCLFILVDIIQDIGFQKGTPEHCKGEYKLFILIFGNYLLDLISVSVQMYFIFVIHCGLALPPQLQLWQRFFRRTILYFTVANLIFWLVNIKWPELQSVLCMVNCINISHFSLALLWHILIGIFVATINELGIRHSGVITALPEDKPAASLSVVDKKND